MTDYTKKTIYNCVAGLLQDLNDICTSERKENNPFAIYEKMFLNVEKNSYQELYMYITTILSSNYPFIDKTFDKFNWYLPLEDFSLESTMNDHSIYDYIEDSGRKNVNAAELMEEFIEYVSKKYADTPYEPDDIEYISFINGYEEERPSTEKDEKELEKQSFEEAIATLKDRLKNDEGYINIPMVVRYIRNALAHNQFDFTEDNIVMYIDDELTGDRAFTCELSLEDMFTILHRYALLVEKNCNEKMKKTPFIMHLLFTNQYDYNYNKMSYDDMKKKLKDEFSKLELTDQFNEITKVSDNIKPEDITEDFYFDYDENCETYRAPNTDAGILEFEKNRYLFNKSKQLIKQRFDKIIEQYKAFEILSVLDDIETILYSSPEVSDYVAGTYANILVSDSIAMITKVVGNPLDISNIPTNNKDFIAKINVLLNTLFLQCSYENIDISSMDFSSMKINTDYIEEKNSVFLPQIKKLYKKYKELTDKIEKSTKAVEEGKVSEDKVRYSIDTNKAERDRIGNRIVVLGNEWASSQSFSNASILNHIRNSFAHGPHIVEPLDDFNDLDSLKVVIKDYEPETNKLSFSGTILLRDLLDQVLNPKIVKQLFDIERSSESR